MNILLLLLTEGPGALPQAHPADIQQTWEQGLLSLLHLNPPSTSLTLIILIFLQLHRFG